MLRRIAIVGAAILIVIALGVYLVPVVLSYYMSRQALHLVRVVPAELKDLSVSQAPGKKLSYFDYEFEVPWTDLDETQTKLFPKENPCKAVLTFRSGLRVSVTAIPPREWARNLSQEMKASPDRVESTFGKSDYAFLKNVYEFTPDRMHHWAISQRVHSREQFLLIIKYAALLNSADTGIFNIQNQAFKGFQEGNPEVRQDGIGVHLLSDEGSIEFIFLQKDYQRPSAVTQPEINRIIQTLRRVSYRK